MEQQQPEAGRPSARHLKVRVNDGLMRQLTEYAGQRELSLSDAVRVLLYESLNPAQLPEEIKVLPAVAFATLLAAEQINCFNQKHFTRWSSDEGDYDLPGLAAEGARKRLQDVELALEEPRRRYRPWDEKPSGLARFLGSSR